MTQIEKAFKNYLSTIFEENYDDSDIRHLTFKAIYEAGYLMNALNDELIQQLHDKVADLTSQYKSSINQRMRYSCMNTMLVGRIKNLRDALDQVRDPRKRPHQESDTYTELGCVMNIADQALQVDDEVSSED